MSSPQKRVPAPQQTCTGTGPKGRMLASPGAIIASVGPVRVMVEIDGRALTEQEAARVQETAEGFATGLWWKFTPEADPATRP